MLILKDQKATKASIFQHLNQPFYQQQSLGDIVFVPF